MGQAVLSSKAVCVVQEVWEQEASELGSPRCQSLQVSPLPF